MLYNGCFCHCLGHVPQVSILTCPETSEHLQFLVAIKTANLPWQAMARHPKTFLTPMDFVLSGASRSSRPRWTPEELVPDAPSLFIRWSHGLASDNPPAKCSQLQASVSLCAPHTHCYMQPLLESCMNANFNWGHVRGDADMLPCDWLSHSRSMPPESGMAVSVDRNELLYLAGGLRLSMVRIDTKSQPGFGAELFLSRPTKSVV